MLLVLQTCPNAQKAKQMLKKCQTVPVVWVVTRLPAFIPYSALGTTFMGRQALASSAPCTPSSPPTLFFTLSKEESFYKILLRHSTSCCNPSMVPKGFQARIQTALLPVPAWPGPIHLSSPILCHTLIICTRKRDQTICDRWSTLSASSFHA